MFKSIQNQLSPYFTKAVLKPVSQVLGSQMLLQFMSLGIGILIVREMPKCEYALYTILMSLQAMLAILSSSGIMIGFRTIGGKIWQSDSDLASLIKTASTLRSYIAAIAFIIVATYGGYLLYKQDLGAIQIVLFLISILFIVIPEIFTAFICEGLLLRKEVVKVQSMLIVNQGLRFVLITILFLFFKEYIRINVVLLITIFSVWCGYYFIVRKSRKIRSKAAQIVPQYRKVLLSYIKKVWHNVAYFAFQSQISIFLIGIFSTTDKLAELGAISRFTLIFIGLSALIKNIVAPRFSRTQIKNRLVKQYWETLFFLGIFSILVFLVAHTFPNIFLWLLGKGYTGLAYELQLVVILGIINLFMGAINNLNETKGWIKFQTFWEIPLNIASLLLGLVLFDITTLQGVIYLSIIMALTTCLLFIANSIYGFYQYRNI